MCDDSSFEHIEGFTEELLVGCGWISKKIKAINALVLYDFFITTHLLVRVPVWQGHYKNDGGLVYNMPGGVIPIHHFNSSVQLVIVKMKIQTYRQPSSCMGGWVGGDTESTQAI